MSLQTFSDLIETEAMPTDKNVRVLITGLAICDNLQSNTPEIEFLRHVPNHELNMIVNQKKRKVPEYNKSISVRIGKMTDVEIMGALTNITQNQITNLIGMQTLHGTTNPIIRRNNLSVEPMTKLKLKNCNFFTAKLTDGLYKFDDTEGTVTTAQQYCEVLGGDMKFSNSFVISLVGGLPSSFQITFQLTDPDIYYEVSFVNSCDNTPGCREQEDFKYMYDIVKQNNNPFRKFRMLLLPSGIGTGACLPACTKC